MEKIILYFTNKYCDSSLHQGKIIKLIELIILVTKDN